MNCLASRPSTLMHWPEPALDSEGGANRGPVIVTFDYRVASQDRVAFRDLAHALSVERRPDGAYAWGILEDVDNPAKITEWFFVAS